MRKNGDDDIDFYIYHTNRSYLVLTMVPRNSSVGGIIMGARRHRHLLQLPLPQHVALPGGDGTGHIYYIASRRSGEEGRC